MCHDDEEINPYKQKREMNCRVLKLNIFPVQIWRIRLNSYYRKQLVKFF